MSNMRPQGASAFSQAQQGAQAQQKFSAEQGLANQYQQALQQMPRGAGGNYQQHAQNPHVQNALQAIGQFLGTIGHPLAGYFGSRMNPVAGAAVGGLNTVGQAGGAAGGALGAGIKNALNATGGAGSAIGQGLNGLLTQTGHAGAAAGGAVQNLYRQQ